MVTPGQLYHGAAHQRPQQIQVMDKSRRPIECGRVRVAFFVRKKLRVVAVRPFNTPRAALNVSTPEATALKLLGYSDRVGGLNQIAMVIAELAERIDPEQTRRRRDGRTS